MLTRQVNSVEDVCLSNLQKVTDLDGKSFNDLKKRKLVVKKTITVFNIQRGPSFGKERKFELADPTFEDVVKYTDEDGNWTGPPIKQMNLNAQAKLPAVGCLHPLMKVRQEFREILLSMGFEEMRTNRFVESSFWNFDTLFQPQAHPARDAHDTFFLKKPASSRVTENRREYFERVKQTHENGWKTGSLGWRTEWKAEEAEKNILRTHTTAISSRTLNELADLYKQGDFRPRKFFSIDRVFRNETIDSTHLAEFHQIEGFCIGKNLTLGHLIGTIHEFFKRIGIPDVKFKPAYNPYTEPSMEIFGWSETKQDFIEVGNSGVFRPEMLLPMGLPPDVNVIAWGLGLERQTMILYKIPKLMELFSSQIDLQKFKASPIPRFDKVQQ